MNVLWLAISFFFWAFWPILVQLRKIWDWIVANIMQNTVGIRRKAALPPVFNPLLLLSATKLAENIRNRKMTSVETVRAFITRCGDVNPIINAITQENFRKALQKAKFIDEYIDQGFSNGTLTAELLEEESPFLGVPFTVKETIAVADMPHTGGLKSRKDCFAMDDAEVIKRMKNSGAILMATTNISEIGIWWECANPLYGRTNNPYDTRRTSGGSSGGEAALMCACGSPLSIGTDSGGSIRTPAFFCGLFGHKPTGGLVPVRGCNIHPVDEDNITIQVAGHQTRHAEDLLPILKILAQDNLEKLNLDRKLNLGKLQIYCVEDDCNRVMTSSVIKPLKDVQKRIAKYFLESFDLSVSKLRILDLQRAYWIWTEKMDEEYKDSTPISSQLADNRGEINIWAEFTRNILNRQRHSFPSLLQASFEKVMEEVEFVNSLKKILTGKETAARSQRKKPGTRQLKMRLQRLLGENGIILYPTHPTFAPFHRESYLKPFNFTYASVFNALGFPVTQVPLGIDPDSNLPLGIQVIGGMYQDKLTIEIAMMLEMAFGGWKCPAKIL